MKFTGKIESQFVFRTALSKSILPFAMYKLDLVVLPIDAVYNKIKEEQGVIFPETWKVLECK